MKNWRKKNKYKDEFKNLSSKHIINKCRNNSNSNSEAINTDNNQTKTTDKNLREEQKITITFSDKVNLGGIVVNTFIAGFTLYALYLTNQSLQVSKDSLDFAKEMATKSDSTSKVNYDLTKRSVEAAIKLSKFADSNYTVTKIGIESSIKNYEKSYKISEQAFNETVNQFNKSNTPFIQSGEFKVSKTTVGQPFFVNSILQNITNIPIKVLKQRRDAKIDKNPYKDKDFENIKYQYETNQYLIKEGVFTNKTTIIPEPITREDSTIIDHKDFYVYIIKECIYQNLVTKKIRHYKYQVKLKYIANSKALENNTYVEFLYNENYDE